MKVLLAYCEQDSLKLAKQYLPNVDIKCINDADSEYIEQANALIILQWKPVKNIISKMKNLKLIQTLSAGVDHIPIEQIPKNATLCSNSGSNAWAVAELAFTLILAALKRSCYRDRAMREGKFPQLLEGRLLKGKKVGIVGFGHIGQALAKMLMPFNVKIYAINRSGVYSGPIVIEYIGKLNALDSILPKIDILVLSVPLTEDTKNMINKERLNKMKKNAILVNVARGKLIEEEKIYKFLLKNKNFTAALDTWWHYDDGFMQHYPFEKLDNVILSPHCGGVYESWLDDAIKYASENIKRLSDGKALINIVYEN